MWRAAYSPFFPTCFRDHGASLAGKALAAGAWALEVVDIRDFATDKHRTVDDTPAGGGPGMVMKADVLGARHRRGRADGRPRLLMSPRGMPLTQGAGRSAGRRARRRPGLRPVRGGRRARHRGARPGRGIDRRLRAVRRRDCRHGADRRLRSAVPGVMGHAASGAEESFARGLLEYPHYTRPQMWEGRPIPEVLLSGDHAKIAAWRHAEAERLTEERRPDLWGLPSRSAVPRVTEGDKARAVA